MTPEQQAKLKHAVEQRVSDYRMSGVPKDLLREWAWGILEVHMPKCPDKVTEKTWAEWGLKRMNYKVVKYVAAEHGIKKIPEHRAYKLGTFIRARDEMAEDLGRQPTGTEIADHLDWTVTEVSRMNKLVRGALDIPRLLTRLGGAA